MGIREEMRDNLNIISNKVEMESDSADLVHSHFCYVGCNLLDIHHYFSNSHITFHTSSRIYPASILQDFPKMATNFGFENL